MRTDNRKDNGRPYKVYFLTKNSLLFSTSLSAMFIIGDWNLNVI